MYIEYSIQSPGECRRVIMRQESKINITTNFLDDFSCLFLLIVVALLRYPYLLSFQPPSSSAYVQGESLSFVLCHLDLDIHIELLSVEPAPALNTSSIFSLCQFFQHKIENTELVCGSRTSLLYFFSLHIRRLLLLLSVLVLVDKWMDGWRLRISVIVY